MPFYNIYRQKLSIDEEFPLKMKEYIGLLNFERKIDDQ